MNALTPLQADREQIARFVDALFRYADEGGFVSLRAFYDDANKVFAIEAHRLFDAAANVRENIAGDVLASGTTMQWNAPAKGWNAGAVMADASLNRRQTIRVGAGVAFAQVGIVGFDGQIELEALRLFGLPEDAPAILYGCPSLPAGARTLALETSWDLPSLGPGATANVDITVPGARRGDFADASLDTSSIAFVLDCHVWSNNSVRVTARNVSASTVDLAAAPLAVQVTKRKVS